MTMPSTWRLPFLLLVAGLVGTAGASAQTGANVLLVANESSPDSLRIAAHYARARAVPPDQVVRLKLEPADEVDRAVFDAQIQAPIAAWLSQHLAQDRILYLVLTKGVPLRVLGSAGRDGDRASVDSELALLYQRLVGLAPPLGGRVPNPYYLGAAAVAQAASFSRTAYDIYLVTRLDGFTAEDVIGLIDRGSAPARDGRILLDQKAGVVDAAGNAWLAAAAERLAAAGRGKLVRLETTSAVLANEKDVIGYYSWGSNDWAITTRRLGLGFVPGAIAGSYTSTDGRTFTEPPPAWTIGTWADRSTFYAGSPQALAGDLVRDGVTGVAAQVAEPYLDAAIRPDILFPAYFAGFNLAESFYLAMPYLSWQTVVVGDPLCAPFARQAPVPAGIDGGIDPDTELPATFSARRLQLLSKETTAAAAKALLRSEARAARRDSPGAQKALEEATAIDPKLVAAQLILASQYELQKAYDKADERYRQVLAVSPDNVIALNNLAYSLAVRGGNAAEAIGLAERAVALSGGRSPEVADTLAWVQHLLGRDREALPILERIVKAAPSRGVFRLHLAVVYAAVGRATDAAAELGEAVRLDPELEKSDQVKLLRARLGR
jgi:uncharacterized protein (TIGR03790 family)